MKVINVFTDGSSINNPGPSGIGIYSSKILNDKKVYRNASIGFVYATNNQVELLACIMAVVRSLKTITGEKHICINTDSQYCIDAVTKWRSGWMLNRWRTSSGEPVKNRDTIDLLGKLYDAGIISFNKVKAHVGIEGNEQADSLARIASQNAMNTKNSLSSISGTASLFKGVHDFLVYKQAVLELEIFKQFN